jgi:hypothetical protein
MNKRAMHQRDATSALRYQLVDGFVHHWLVAGPQPTPSDEDGADPTALQQPQPPHGRPIHLSPLSEGDQALRWQVLRCAADHFLHLTGFATPTRSHVWLYATLVHPGGGETGATLTAYGRATIWLNGRVIHRQQVEPVATLPSSTFSLPLQAGDNDLLLCCEQVEPGAHPWRLALHLSDQQAETAVQVALPRPEGTRGSYAERFQSYERLFDQATLDRDLFTGPDQVAVHWPQKIAGALPLHLRLQTPGGQIFAETIGAPKAGGQTRTLAAARLPSGRYEALLMPPPSDYTEGGLRVRRLLPLTVLSEPPQQIGAMPYLERLAGSLQQVMRRRQGLAAELAAMTLGAWRYVKPAPFHAAVEEIHRRQPGSVRTVLALLALMEKYERQPDFPAPLRPLVENCLRSYDYCDTGSEASAPLLPESESILHLAAQIVAGQRYPAQVLDRTGRTGSSLRRAAEAAARAWLVERGCYGFQTMLDDERLDDLVFALCQLQALAKETTVRELAAVLLDKLFFTAALHTLDGVGPGGLLAPVAALGRVLWGEGICNLHVWGLIGLADSGYELPGPLAKVATERSQDQWLHERHRDPDGAWQIERSTYRTLAFALTSVADGTTPALRNRRRRWQATLSPEAVVFVNHPAHLGDEQDDLPNFWMGDASPPRLAHWRDTLVALYRLPAADWLGFTHAYFPLYAFDETLIRDNWVLGRRGNGLIALTASVPITVVSTGPGAHRDVRAVGREVAWLCQLGSTQEQKSITEFLEQLQARTKRLAIEAVDFTSPHGERIEFGWEQALFVNGLRREAASDRHYDTPYCVVEFPAELMNIQVGNQVLQLDFR